VPDTSPNDPGGQSGGEFPDWLIPLIGEVFDGIGKIADAGTDADGNPTVTTETGQTYNVEADGPDIVFMPTPSGLSLPIVALAGAFLIVVALVARR